MLTETLRILAVTNFRQIGYEVVGSHRDWETVHVGVVCLVTHESGGACSDGHNCVSVIKGVFSTWIWRWDGILIVIC